VNHQAIVFDLDGTLLDTLDDLADAANAALRQHGHPAHPVDAYRHFIGDGVWNLIERALPAPARQEDAIRACVEVMGAIYRENWAVKTRPYPGIPELLAELSRRGLMVSVLTNKPQEFSQVMLDYFFPDYAFHTVFGARPEVALKPDPAGARLVLRAMGVQAFRAVMLGDSSVDMQTAVNAGMHPVGAAWGFRGRQELLDNGAALVIAHPAELMAAL